MNYSNLRQRTKQFESVTGLKVDEFDQLLSVFSSKWRNFYRIHTIEGKKRKAPIMNPDKDTKSLCTVEEKLFFILVYLKNYSLQTMLSASFGFSQSQASKWQKVLCPLLFDTLDSLKMLPLRDAHRVAQALENLGQTRCFQDASERLIERPQDQDTQQQFFSGKKKHTR
ncbi:MAG: transposase family protein [Bacteroidota bacterium]